MSYVPSQGSEVKGRSQQASSNAAREAPVRGGHSYVLAARELVLKAMVAGAVGEAVMAEERRQRYR